MKYYLNVKEVSKYKNENKNKLELAREYGTLKANVRAWIKTC